MPREAIRHRSSSRSEGQGRKGLRYPEAEDKTSQSISEPPRRTKSSPTRSKSSPTRSKSSPTRRSSSSSGKRGKSDKHPKIKTPNESNSDLSSVTFEFTTDKHATAVISHLKKKLLEVKAKNKELENALKIAKSTMKEDLAELNELEEENLDMQHDLAETRRIKDRLERENSHLLKKLNLCESENSKLQAKLDELSGVKRDCISPEYEELEEEFSTANRRTLERNEKSRQSLWSLLAEETLADTSTSPVTSTGSKSNLFDSFFNKNVMSGTFNNSVSESTSQPQGGFIPAA